MTYIPNYDYDQKKNKNSIVANTVDLNHEKTGSLKPFEFATKSIVYTPIGCFDIRH